MKWLFGSSVTLVLANRYNKLGIRGNILEKWKRENAFKALQILEREESRKREIVKMKASVGLERPPSNTSQLQNGSPTFPRASVRKPPRYL